MSYLEAHIPELAEGAVKQAYCKNLAAGRKMVEAVNGQLIESFPDGSSRVIKPLEAPTPVVPGQRRVRMFAGPNGSEKSTITGVEPAPRK
ncbi:MAG: hypothetical protein FWF31_04395 [Desulfobulbus sp.]|nr:hypothetical protein [Desulfobulbus sp.]